MAWTHCVARPVFATGVSACEVARDFRHLISEMREGSSVWTLPQQDPSDLPEEPGLVFPAKTVSGCKEKGTGAGFSPQPGAWSII